MAVLGEKGEGAASALPTRVRGDLAPQSGAISGSIMNRGIVKH